MSPVGPPTILVTFPVCVTKFLMKANQSKQEQRVYFGSQWYSLWGWGKSCSRSVGQGVTLHLQTERCWNSAQFLPFFSLEPQPTLRHWLHLPFCFLYRSLSQQQLIPRSWEGVKMGSRWQVLAVPVRIAVMPVDSFFLGWEDGFSSSVSLFCIWGLPTCLDNMYCLLIYPY